jgi:hypothetical protein
MTKTSMSYLSFALSLFFCIVSTEGPVTSVRTDGVAEPARTAAHDNGTAGSGEDWHSQKTLNGMAAEVAGEAQTPDGPAKVTLSFECTPGKGGTSVVDFVVLGATKLTGFDFDDFEGPDAPAKNKPLVTFTVQPVKGNEVIVTTVVSGSYTVTDQGFAFEAYNMANEPGKVTQLSDAIAAGASSISVRVQGFKHSEKTLQATFSTNGAAEIVKQAMKACGKH